MNPTLAPGAGLLLLGAACAFAPGSARAENLLTVHVLPVTVASSLDENGQRVKLWQRAPDSDSAPVQWSDPEISGKPVLLPEGWYRLRLVDRPPQHPNCTAPPERVIQVKAGQPAEVTLTYSGPNCG